jgi:adenylate kinase family enzyme
MERVVVIGSSSGAGKTRLGRALAARLGVPFVELDALFWRQGNWIEPEREVFRARVEEATRGERWVVDGNYSQSRDIVWPRADTVVWLDPPFPVMYWRILRRTIPRILRREVLWAGNRETFRNTFFSRNSLLVWSLRTYPGRRQRFERALVLPEHAHLTVHRFRSNAAAWRWLALLPSLETRATGAASRG